MSAFLTLPANTPRRIGGELCKNVPDIDPPDYRIEAQGDAPRYSDLLWPRSCIQINLGAAGYVFDNTPDYWEWNFPPTGVHVPKKISGVTKDSSGNPLGGCTVQIFNASTGLLVATVTSDSAGNYYASDPNAVNCFAVAYEAGSPDVAGTTKNNLTGT